METTIKVGGLECDSCAKVISRIANKIEGCTIKSIDYSMGRISVEYNNTEKLDELKNELTQAGYSIGDTPVNHRTVQRPLKFFKAIFSENNEFVAERTIIESSLSSFLVMLVITTVLQTTIPLTRPYFDLLVLLSFGITAFYVALIHHQAFAEPTSCMTGMMVGMTLGMIGGFMFGSIAGAANGMFVGSLTGMFIGMFFGAIAGSTVGVMGVMEGLMAGLMSGTMGAMLSVMLFSDNVILFLVILFAVCIAILMCLPYLLYKENGTVTKEKVPSVLMAIASNTVFFSLFTLLIVWGPHSALSWITVKGG